jgi:hypothetical protein
VYACEAIAVQAQGRGCVPSPTQPRPAQAFLLPESAHYFPGFAGHRRCINRRIKTVRKRKPEFLIEKCGLAPALPHIHFVIIAYLYIFNGLGGQDS